MARALTNHSTTWCRRSTRWETRSLTSARKSPELRDEFGYKRRDSEVAVLEFDCLRSDLEELSLGPEML
ncbi:unnamed protein product [Pleuronectes platessa]|uniref:Uncharacterized protein n=1 Tax=Pleuronectes platessa TaxID=8262 RepID=A0A9N7VZJ3_PLEPL|nr:unnamed protein product [Pleuronectes platessa]